MRACVRFGATGCDLLWPCRSATSRSHDAHWGWPLPLDLTRGVGLPPLHVNVRPPWRISGVLVARSYPACLLSISSARGAWHDASGWATWSYRRSPHGASLAPHSSLVHDVGGSWTVALPALAFPWSWASHFAFSHPSSPGWYSPMASLPHSPF